MTQKQIRIELTVMVDDDEMADELVADVVDLLHDRLDDGYGGVHGGYNATLYHVLNPA